MLGPFAAAASLVAAGYVVLRGVVRLFRRKVVVTSRPPTVAATGESARLPLVASKDVVLSCSLTVVKNAATFAKKVAASVQEATVALSRGLINRAKSVWYHVRAVYISSKAFFGVIVRAVFSTDAASAILARKHTRLLVVSREVTGLLKPFLKSHPRNRDAIIPAIDLS